jgi:hypothetical protein
MSQNGKEPHDGDGEVLSVRVSLRERGAVHEEDRYSDGDVEGQAEGRCMHYTMRLAQQGVRAKAELDLAAEIEAVDGPRPKREVCD